MLNGTPVVVTPLTVTPMDVDPVWALRNASPAQPFLASSDIQIPIAIDSSNFIPFVVDSAKLVVYVKDARGNPLKYINGTGEMNQITIYSKQRTSIAFPIQISFRAKKPVFSVRDDSILQGLSSICSSMRDSVTLDGSLSVLLNVQKAFGFAPINFQFTKSFNCIDPLVRLRSIAINATN
jgi:hypothetical protein